MEEKERGKSGLYTVYVTLISRQSYGWNDVSLISMHNTKQFDNLETINLAYYESIKGRSGGKKMAAKIGVCGKSGQWAQYIGVSMYLET